MELVNKVEKRAIEVARKVVREVGFEAMESLVRDSLELDRELAGPEATEFYKERLGMDTIRKLNTIALEFFEDPTGDGKTEDKKAA